MVTGANAWTFDTVGSFGDSAAGIFAVDFSIGDGLVETVSVLAGFDTAGFFVSVRGVVGLVYPSCPIPLDSTSALATSAWYEDWSAVMNAAAATRETTRRIAIAAELGPESPFEALELAEFFDRDGCLAFLRRAEILLSEIRCSLRSAKSRYRIDDGFFALRTRTGIPPERKSLWAFVQQRRCPFRSDRDHPQLTLAIKVAIGDHGPGLKLNTRFRDRSVRILLVVPIVRVHSA